MKRSCPGCGETTAGARCSGCERQRQRQRGSPTQRGYDGEYQRNRKRVLETQGVCAYCYEAAATTVDHVVPLARGGTNAIDNLVPACQSCNSSKGAR